MKLLPSPHRTRKESGEHRKQKSVMEGRDGAAPRRGRADDGGRKKRPSRISRRERPPVKNGERGGVDGTNGTRAVRPPPPSDRRGSGGDGVTVDQFLVRQRSMQDRASSSRTEAARQRRLQESFGHDGDRMNDGASADLDDGDGGGAIVPHDPNRAGGPRVVDAVPADHPSSGIVQSHRTCTLCHRDLPRSQFSERDRFGVSLSIAPGAVCRTCAMTVCAVRLKSMPTTEHLLLEYAQRGERMIAAGGMGGSLLTGPPPRNAGLLEGDPNGSSEGALVVRRGGDSLEGRELTVFNGESAGAGSLCGAPHEDVPGIAPVLEYVGKTAGQTGDRDPRPDLGRNGGLFGQS